MNTDDRELQRVRFAECRGQKRQGEDAEELAANAEEQHLDADVEVRADKSYRAEDVARNAAAAAPDQMRTEERSMNSFASSRAEVFEKIEELLRQCKGVEDLKDDEIVALCILSKELNACDPSSFVSHATRLRLRERFAFDLTAATANGTINVWLQH